MDLLRQLFPFWASAAPARPPTALVEPLPDRGRLEDELATVLARAHEQTQAQADVAGQLDRLLGEVGKLGREQFRTTTLLEGQGVALDELAEAWRDHLERHECEAAELRRALVELDERVRHGWVKDLLPVADALDASVRAARELLVEVPAQPPADRSLLARLRVVLGGPTGPAAVDRGARVEAWLEGLLLIEQRLLALLEREGVRPIPALGRPFDPHRHLAVAVERAGSVPDGTVVGEERRGYTHGDRVLRHAEVVVARGPSSGPGVPRTAER
jgi:molecular chaperone GrpE (heat shock protein)